MPFFSKPPMILIGRLKPEAAESSNGQQPSVESLSNKVGAGIVPASDPPVDAGPNRRKPKHLCEVAVIFKSIRQFFPCVIAGISRYDFIDKKSTWNRRIAACMQKQLQTDKKFSVCKTAFNIVRQRQRSVSALVKRRIKAGNQKQLHECQFLKRRIEAPVVQHAGRKTGVRYLGGCN